ncbi:hypothetical protein AB0M00_43685 [Streptomyces chartreusis]|uniref:hypothetical protein n=1 Tax=Streptomyces chartreusis TaxID=1969 RepID=UPI00343FE749
MTAIPETTTTVHLDVPLTLPTDDGGTFRVRQPIGAHRTQTEGLVVFPALIDLYDFDESRWHVTHVDTGLRLPVEFDTEEQAAAFAGAVGPLVDWTQPRPALPVDVRMQVMELALEHGGRLDQRVREQYDRRNATPDGGGE